MNMNRSLPLLANVRVASPCSMKWEDMEGDDKTRHCASCRLNVHNLSAMTSAEAEALLSRTLGAGERLCGAFYRRADGTVLTQDCPVGLAAVRARVRRRVTRVAAALGLVATGGALAAGSGSDSVPQRLRALRPFSILAEWLSPAPPPPSPPIGRMIKGEIACPVAPPPPIATPVEPVTGSNPSPDVMQTPRDGAKTAGDSTHMDG
jgi:hypothetical protein